MYSDQGYSYVFKRDLNDDSDGAHLTSFGIEFQTEEEAKENEQSPSVALLCAGKIKKCISLDNKLIITNNKPC